MQVEHASGSGLQACQPAVVGPMNVAIRRLSDEQKKQLRVCFHTAYFVVKEELPFTMYPSLLSLQNQPNILITHWNYFYGNSKECLQYRID